MRVLITGAGGQLGSDLVEAFVDHEVVGCDHATLDVADRDAVHQTIGGVEPDVVVHAGAWTAVDACEGDPDRAFGVNALGTRWVGEACRRAGAYLVYVSTDYVFDGTKSTPYREWDRTNPQSVYGRSKLGGELELGPDAAIVRTSWVCGLHGNNMVRTVLRLAEGDGVLRFVDDQIGKPSFTEDLAAGISQLARRRIPGVFHLTNGGAVSWYEFVGEILHAAGHSRDRVEPISTTDLDPPRPAPRPANSVLDDAAWRAARLDPLPHFTEPLARLVAQLT